QGDVQHGVVQAHDQQAHAADREHQEPSARAELGHGSHRTHASIVRLTNGRCTGSAPGTARIRDNGAMPTPTAAPGSTLAIGPHTVSPPVVLAPMAGITNAPFRTLCGEFSGGKGLFVSEMITTRALVERNDKTMQLIHFDASE